MKTKSVIKALSHFRSFQDNKGGTLFQSRANLGRIIRVVDQDGNAISLPLYVDKNGREEVAFHATTIKSLVQFLEEVQSWPGESDNISACAGDDYISPNKRYEVQS